MGLWDRDRKEPQVVTMSRPRVLPAGMLPIAGASDAAVPGRYVLPLVERRVESPSTLSFRFSTEGTGFSYRSTQAVRLGLPGVDDPWGAVRTFSISSSPSERGIVAITSKISETPFKQALARLRPGDTAHLFGPLGQFFFDPSRPALFLAGGIGVTPFRGMMRFAADLGTSQPVTLLYSARVPEELIFREELDALARAHPRLSVQYTVTRPRESSTEWAGRVGRIDRTWIAERGHLERKPICYVAGLPEMVAPTLELLTRELGVPADDTDYEVFRGF